MAQRTLKARWLWALATLSFAGTLWGLPFPWIIAAAAAVGVYMARIRPEKLGSVPAIPTASPSSGNTAWLSDNSEQPFHTHYSSQRLWRAIAVGLGLWALSLCAIAWLFGAGHTLTQMGGFFTQAALLTFGGAYAVLPYVTQAAVVQYGWLTAAQMMDGLALGESTPGPLIMVVAFVGFLGGHSQALLGHPLLGGVVAACVVTWFTFLPSFVFILAGGPLVESTRHMPALTGPLHGITAAVIGVILHLAGTFARQTWLPGGWHMLPDLSAIALTCLAIWALVWKGQTVVRVLAACVLLGLVRQALL